MSTYKCHLRYLYQINHLAVKENLWTRLFLKTPSSARKRAFFRLAKTAKQAILVLSSIQLPMYIGTVRWKTSRSKPDRVFRQSLDQLRKGPVPDQSVQAPKSRRAGRNMLPRPPGNLSLQVVPAEATDTAECRQSTSDLYRRPPGCPWCRCQSQLH